MIESGHGLQAFIVINQSRIIMAVSTPSSGQAFLMDGLDLLSALFAGPGHDCLELVSEHIPAFARDLANAPDHLAPVFARLVEAWSPQDPAAFCRDMESEYVRIFINTKGGIAASLYHSVYQQGSPGLMGTAAADMFRLLSQKGLEIGHQGEPPDHLCIEIEYLAHVLGEGNAAEITREARDFAGFMRQWVPDFKQALLDADPPEAYALAAEALEAVLGHLA